MYKGINTTLDEGQTPIVTIGGGFDVAQPVAGTLGNRGLRSHTEIDGHGAYIPVAIQGTVIGRSEHAGPQGSGADASGAMFTLTKTDVHAVAFGGDIARSLTARHDSSPCADRSMDVVAVALRGREGGATAELGDEVQNCLRASSGGGDKPHILSAMQVRRLTPVECERLQGFPDGYTNIPWRNKPESPDGPRYKALGNSMAVPVMRWIGERINEVSKL
jgi:site-specific DNA-cytosine methylase